MTIQCPKCNQQLRIPDDKTQAQFRCPLCKHEFRHAPKLPAWVKFIIAGVLILFAVSWLSDRPGQNRDGWQPNQRPIDLSGEDLAAPLKQQLGITKDHPFGWQPFTPGNSLREQNVYHDSRLRGKKAMYDKDGNITGYVDQ